jgi:hypothetical protein
VHYQLKDLAEINQYGNLSEIMKQSY